MSAHSSQVAETSKSPPVTPLRAADWIPPAREAAEKARLLRPRRRPDCAFAVRNPWDTRLPRLNPRLNG
jgi:hypothetical protein